MKKRKEKTSFYTLFWLLNSKKEEKIVTIGLDEMERKKLEYLNDRIFQAVFTYFLTSNQHDNHLTIK